MLSINFTTLNIVLYQIFLLIQPINYISLTLFVDSVSMGTCSCKSIRSIKRNSNSQEKSQQSTLQSYISKQNKDQIHCLKLIYDDLASRCPQKLMNAKTFSIFFHMNRVIGGSLFRKFFKTNNCSITEEMFIQAVLRFSKQDIQEKIKFLFTIFDLNENKGVSFNEMLALLLNYPQQEMKEVLSKEEFLQSLTTQQMSYYLVNSKKMDPEKLQKQYRSSLSLFPHLSIRKKSSTFQLERHQIFDQQDPCAQQKGDLVCQKLSEKSVLKNEFKKNIDKSQLTTEMFKKYIEYLFKINHLDRYHDEISFETFKHILKEHPKLYQQSFEGFHCYLWRYDNGVALFTKKVPHISGFCTQVCGMLKKRIYLVNIKNSLLIFEAQEMNRPISIKNLEGLTISQSQINNNEGYGIILRHQDGLYQECSYYFSNKQIQQEWLSQLNQFQMKDVNKKYQNLQKIGKGSFSIVYKCQSLENGEIRAMKIINKVDRTEQEIAAVNYQSQILATCAMPNVVKAYQRFEDKNHIYLIMQLIDGGTLYEYVKKKHVKHLEQNKVKFIMKQLLSTICDLHGIGIIHRDLKLQNILMKVQDRKQFPKIIDFGLAIYKIDLPNINEQNKYVGTPNFVAPEIFSHSEYDQTVDIFSLGVIMHFLLTGILPFHSVDIHIIRQLTLQCEINYESKYWEKTSESAKNLLTKMICTRQNRVSAQEALNHEWFRQNNPQSH